MDKAIAFSPKTKLELFNALNEDQNTFSLIFGRSHYIFDFLRKIWDIDNLPSTDNRFKTAEQDVHQHMINNDDWDSNFLFLDRFRLLDDDLSYKNFLEAIVFPQFRKDEDEIIKFVFLINSYISKDGYRLGVKYYNGQNLPIYEIKTNDEKDYLPFDLKQNDITIYFTKTPTGRSDRSQYHPLPPHFPAFSLVFNKGWNDFNILSSFSLFFYDEKKSVNYIGELKIIAYGEVDTSQHLNNKFEFLSDNFCSLGKNIDYYNNLKRLLGRNFESVLYALKDAAFFPEIVDKFEKEENFNLSIIRDNKSERLIREAKYILYDYNLSNLYSFKYSFKPLYSADNIEVDFNFNNIYEVPNRIYALIGKNGTGKTQLITSLPNNISEKKEILFSPKIPLFSKIIAVSYSIFDKINFPERTSSFNYVFCGLWNEEHKIMTDEESTLKFYNSCSKIEKMERIEKWHDILLTFLDVELVELIITKKTDSQTKNNSFVFNNDGFNDIKSRLSSGQASILYIITEIVANIRFDSLLLFDEPETHLHPNAITQLMNTIYELVNKFESFCIIATHSPLVVRELFSRNVYVVERHENTPSVRKIPLVLISSKI